MLLIQSILVQGTGAPSGTEVQASGVPEALRLPAELAPGPGEVWLHSVHAHERHGFTLSSWLEQVAGPGPFPVPLAFPQVELRLSGERLEVVGLEGETSLLFALLRGETGQVRLQAQRSSFNAVWSERHAINIGWLSSYDAEIFLSRAFDYHHDDLPDRRQPPP